MKFGDLIIRKIFKFVATNMPDFKAKNPNSISAGAPAQISLGELTVLPRPSNLIRGLLLRDWRRGGGKWKCYGEGEEREEEGIPKGWFTPHVRNPEKYSDCRTDLIGGAV